MKWNEKKKTVVIFTETCRIKTMHLKSGPCSRLTERRATAGYGNLDSLVITLMLCAHTHTQIGWKEFPRCQTLNMKIQTMLSSPSVKDDYIPFYLVLTVRQWDCTVIYCETHAKQTCHMSCTFLSYRDKMSGLFHSFTNYMSNIK